MTTHIIEGKPKKTVTIEVDGHSLTLTEGIEITVIVVVASQQSFAPDAANGSYCDECGVYNDAERKVCRKCGTPRR